MENFKEIGQQIFDFVNSPMEKAKRGLLGIDGTRFIVYGISGSGKTSAIDVANSLLPLDEQIAESQELLRERDVLKALESFDDVELRYECSKHIGFSVITPYLAKDMEARGVKVFWLDNLSSSDHLKLNVSTGLRQY